MRRGRSLTALLVFAAVLAAGARTSWGDGDPGIAGRLAGEDGAGPPPALHLVAERKLDDLLHGGHRFEASGVEVQGDALWVVFDDRTDVARVAMDLGAAEWVKARGHGPGYEGIAWAPRARRFHCVVEADRHDHAWRARVATYTPAFELEDEAWLDVDLPEENKGFEGLAYVERDGRGWLLALREGDPDDQDDDGLVRGRIEVFAQKDGGHGWRRRGTLKLPKAARFADYSGIDVLDDQVVVVSQTSSRLWVGRLEPDAWAWRDAGRVWSFPGEDAEHGPMYRTVEGVAWLDRGRVVVVSDLLKDGHRGQDKDQSIHVFALAAGAE